MASEQVVSTTHLNVRSGPGLAFGKLWVAKPGTSLPALGREGKWLKVQLVQYREGQGFGFYIDSSDQVAQPNDTVEVALLTAGGMILRTESLPKSSIVLMDRTGRHSSMGSLRRVHIRRVGYVFAGMTSDRSGRTSSTDGHKSVQLELARPPRDSERVNWAQLNQTSRLYMPLSTLKDVGRLDSGAVVQVLSEEKGYLKVQVSSSDLKDTLFVDLNQFYDLNAGDTATLVSGRRDSVQSLGSVRKDKLRFDPNRAFFGPGVSRLVPVELDLPLLVDAKAAKRFQSLKDVARALPLRKETHPKFFFPKEIAAQLVKLARQDLESVITPKWFLVGGVETFTFGLTLKTVAVREMGRNPEEYFFQKYVRRVLEAYRPCLGNLQPFSDFIIEVEYLQPGRRGEALWIRTLSFRVPRKALDSVASGEATYKDLYNQVVIQQEVGNT